MTWEFSSPLTLLGGWRDRADAADLHELLLLGFTVDLPFLEKTLVPTARVLGARVTVVGDAAQGLYDPVDVRMAGRAYFHGLAACRDGAFHPKLALLIGADDVVAAIGSGNPTMAGWGYNDELWTVLRGRVSHAPEGLHQLGEWLGRLGGVVSMPGYVRELLQEIAARLGEFQVSPHPTRVLGNLDGGLLDRLPSGPVDELRLYAPFVDGNGRALSRIVEHFDPVRVVVGVQERWSSYDGDVILRALGGRDAELRLLPERRPRHGKLLEWESGGSWSALTGSANLTASALLEPAVAGGNCELGVLAPTSASLLPEGVSAPLTRLRGRRTVRPVRARPTLLVLGALLTGTGMLQVTLARPYDIAVTAEVSPDGSPGSWITIGTIAAGTTFQEFAAPEAAGAVVRIVDPRTESHTESPPVFVVHPARCARRRADDDRPTLRHAYAEEEIFTDEELARRFRYDLLRLSDQLAERRTARPGTARTPAASAVHDRWAAYLDECERAVGRPLTLALFGRAGMPDPSPGLRWGVTADITTDDAEEPTDPAGEAAATEMTASQRVAWQRWIARAVSRTVPGEPESPLMVRILVARLFVQLLAHGVWDLTDDSWRGHLARLTGGLMPGRHDDLPVEAVEQARTLTAVCMGLLRSGVALTGGTPADLIAARTWRAVRGVIAEVNAEAAGDLLIPPVLPRAHVLGRSEWEGLLDLAADHDPLAPVVSELAEDGLELEYIDGLHRVTGRFRNPVPVAARIATLLEDHLETALVHAVADGRWAFVAWRRPHLVLAVAPLGNSWRVYRVDQPATPESRLGGEGLPQTGLIGRAVRLGQEPPDIARQVLAQVGIDHVLLLRRLTA
ncbi:hypothetical protein [Thermomonospora umbrina]|uniref:Uncharacterized protein n=1 Tax=Thermomonospora umbrina TaxID=111806 RepID=A0A3D9SVE5_9ACTN|nr:hypothetical protein [Thermomonospora umbrina]REE95641.1 hypothetical protein DFJ69_1049 [Thermomonospora umbrina]